MTPQQAAHYRTFGFVVLRQMFTPEEMGRMQQEFTVARQREGDFMPIPGESCNATFVMLGDDTPFCANLTEDERLLGAARDLVGERALLWEWRAYRYFTAAGTHWHANDGDSTHGRHLYGLRFQWPLFRSVRADSGALRFIAGSHDADYQQALRAAGEAGLLEPISDVDAVVCEADPGDVVAFDTRVYHATAPFPEERNVFSAIYLHYPQTPEQVAVTAPTLPQDQQQWHQWRRNSVASAYRARWEDLLVRLKEEQRSCSLRVVAGEPGGPRRLVRG